MKTKDVIFSLKCCVKGDCSACPMNNGKTDCEGQLLAIAASTIEKQETRIQALENDIAKLENDKSWAEEIAMSDSRRDFW